MEHTAAADATRDTRLARRRQVMWGHALIAVAALLAYLYAVNLPIVIPLVTSPVEMLLIGVPAFLPYLVSAIHCWNLYTWQVDGPSPLRIVVFLATLLIGAVLVESAFLGVYGPLERPAVVILVVDQAGAYMWAGELILNVV